MPRASPGERRGGRTGEERREERKGRGGRRGEEKGREREEPRRGGIRGITESGVGI
jgi:hypothetical protein